MRTLFWQPIFHNGALSRMTSGAGCTKIDSEHGLDLKTTVLLYLLERENKDKRKCVTLRGHRERCHLISVMMRIRLT